MVEPTPRRRQLGVVLRQLREAQGWTGEEAARRLGYKSPGTVSKIEKGTQGVTIQQLPNIFQVYGIESPDLQDSLRNLVRRAREPDWWQRYEGVVDDPLGDYLTQVELASALFSWNPHAVPGLLQTRAYARAVVEASRAWKTTEDIDHFVDLRMEHQAKMAARTPPLRFWAVIPEGVLRQEVGGRPVMREQLQHLAALAADEPNITIQVLPFSAGAHAGMDGPFLHLTFPAGPDVIVIESMRASLHMNQAISVEQYRTTGDLLKTEAQARQASVRLLTSIAKDLA
ncbi:helix-turn-helix domain-containing protein [Streptomyces brasiliscabiei]|uniref:helix-turn-helix domain-containing protein n=1 Tax=Streptomyces brasiliscabiei TaxID=2736302 RepID=UPI001C0FEDBB|nr:helix-turn-helix transcriptional regulator [Streptomyces brasiliscabiei]